MNVYVSADFSRAAEANAYAYQLRRDGISVVSSWHQTPQPPATMYLTDADLTNDQRAEAGLVDLDDLERADCLVSLWQPMADYTGGGGALIEFGVAINMGIHLVIVGHRTAVFHYLPGVVFAPDADAARVYLRDLSVARMGRAA